MWFGILGPTDVRLDGGRVVAVGGPRVRALLALLLLDAGLVVTAERLADGLWDGAAGHLVVSHPAGYRLAVDPGDVDVDRFEWLAADGRRAGPAADVSSPAGGRGGPCGGRS